MGRSFLLCAMNEIGLRRLHRHASLRSGRSGCWDIVEVRSNSVDSRVVIQLHLYMLFESASLVVIEAS